jgi:2-oxoglutarate ferredoxin oxidoreductase subunit beta
MSNVATLKKKDFQSDQVVRWCPGCGDYAILSAIQATMPRLDVPKEEIVFISGIGCSSRFPYYMNTYGFHTIHGRAPTIVSGLKIANPKLTIFQVTGDGDGLSIGGNHLLHILRRNMDVTILLFNNRIYGLTKGQFSPTSEIGKKTKSSPMGSLETPIQPLRFALAAEASFVARTYDANVKHMEETFLAAAKHKGTSFVEILQNCVIFNKGAYEGYYERTVRNDRMIHMEEGKPLVFGSPGEKKGLCMDGMNPVVRSFNGDKEPEGLLTHNPDGATRAYADMLAGLEYPESPVPVGVFRKNSRPTYNDLIHAQVTDAKAQLGEGKLEDLFNEGDTWDVK